MKARCSRVVLHVLAGLAAGCFSGEKGGAGTAAPGPLIVKTPALVRADRRAYDGAPPVIPHQPFGGACGSCHTRDGLQFGDMGYAPPSPHENTPGMGVGARCEQCHDFRSSPEVFRENTFAGLRQDLRHGRRLNAFAPPVMPHQTLLRENCVACHSGPAAREEIRTPHPERERCRQCHVAVASNAEFVRQP